MRERERYMKSYVWYYGNNYITSFFQKEMNDHVLVDNKTVIIIKYVFRLKNYK